MSETLRELFKGNPSPSNKSSEPEPTPTPDKEEKPATAPKQEKFECQKCGKEYKTKSGLTNHEKKCEIEQKVQSEKDSAETADEAVQIFFENPTERDKMRMQIMVESLYRIHGRDNTEVFTEKATYFMGQIKNLFSFSQYDPKDLEQLISMLPTDTHESIEKSKERMAQYMKSPGVPPETLVQWRKLMIGWKARLGELIAKYKPLTLAYELGYYSLRGSAFVALTHFGRSLERNVKEGTTVKDREQQAQIMTLGIAQERVYYDFVVEVLIQNQRALADMIDNMEHELIELRHQRRTENAPSY